MVVIGDSTAAELGGSLSETAKITGKGLADVIRQLSKTVFRSSVRSILVVAGRDAMRDDDTVETFVGQCEKLAGILGSYPNTKVYWMIPPFVSDKADKYDDLAISLIAMLEKTTFEMVATKGLRSVAEIFRFGGRYNRFYVDTSGSLTDAGRVQVLEYLREVRRFPLNETKKNEQAMKRANDNSGHGARDAKQHRSTYEKRRSEQQYERKLLIYHDIDAI